LSSDVTTFSAVFSGLYDLPMQGQAGTFPELDLTILPLHQQFKVSTKS
jgi:hypothetical protein